MCTEHAQTQKHHVTWREGYSSEHGWYWEDEEGNFTYVSPSELSNGPVYKAGSHPDTNDPNSPDRIADYWERNE